MKEAPAARQRGFRLAAGAIVWLGGLRAHHPRRGVIARKPLKIIHENIGWGTRTLPSIINLRYFSNKY